MTSKFFKLSSVAFALVMIGLLSQCSDEAIISPTVTKTSITTSITSTVSSITDCSQCAYVVPATAYVVDGAKLGLKPGSVIGLSAGVAYRNLIFRNIVGTPEQPIIIKNCGGTALLNGTGLPFSIKTETSKHFRITGGNVHNAYGIQINGGHMGITLDKLSTNFEVDHVEIKNSGFAGIMAKTDPSCDDATIRGNFLMEKVSLHHNYIHETGGEGFYVGHSAYETGGNTPCGKRLPHEIHNVRIFENKVKNTGWDGIQLGCATKIASVYGNTIENFGVENISGQRNGIQIGAGTTGYCYGNLIKTGNGNGIAMFGLGGNVVYNNIIVSAGEFGIFCDERGVTTQGYKFVNNTIISPKLDGIRIYAETVPMNFVINNIIANPGTFSTHVYPRSSEDSFIFKLSNAVKVEAVNNYFTNTIDVIQFANLLTENYRTTLGSPVIDKGADISLYNINTDFYKKARLKGVTYDIGAVEF